MCEAIHLTSGLTPDALQGGSKTQAPFCPVAFWEMKEQLVWWLTLATQSQHISAPAVWIKFCRQIFFQFIHLIWINFRPMMQSVTCSLNGNIHRYLLQCHGTKMTVLFLFWWSMCPYKICRYIFWPAATAKLFVSQMLFFLSATHTAICFQPIQLNALFALPETPNAPFIIYLIWSFSKSIFNKKVIQNF